MPPQPEIDNLPAVSPRDLETYTRWRQVCELVQSCRADGLPTAANDLLERMIAANPKDTLAPFFQLWLADNFLLAGDLRLSIAAYRQLHEKYSDRRFCGEALGAIGLQSAAQAHARLGEVREAIATLAEAADNYGGACYPANLAYTAGCIAERANLLPEAIEAFTTATKAEDPFRRTGEQCRDLAERCLRRLQSKRSGVRPSAEILAQELSTALSERNARALKELASPTHFSIAALGSERGFIDAEPVLEILLEDLAGSELKIFSEKLGGSGEKRYLDTAGWKGKLGSDVVRFILTWAPGGFEWGGIAFTPSSDAPDGTHLFRMARPRDDDGGKPLPGDPHDPPDVPDPTEPPQPPPIGVSGAGITVADLGMKSPWVSGSHFYAGGINAFVGRIAMIQAAVIAGGPFAALLIDKLIPDADCGFGFGGLYYGQPPTHQGRSFFAIDFASFGRIGINLAALMPLEPASIAIRMLETNQTFSHPCLAVADGIVVSVFSATPTGGTVTANHVEVDHVSSKEQGAVAIAFFIALLTGVMPKLKLRYTAQYLHLDGPGKISVSAGMYVKQGKRLGLMDDTGTSVAHHLHFALFDNVINFSVRPMPMDGQTLWEWDDGRCMHSTNVLIP